jgi:hypothetical protein
MIKKEKKRKKLIQIFKFDKKKKKIKRERERESNYKSLFKRKIFSYIFFLSYYSYIIILVIEHTYNTIERKLFQQLN